MCLEKDVNRALQLLMDVMLVLQRVSKAESAASSLFADPATELPDLQESQEYIRDRFTMLENRLEDYLDSVTEDIAQDLEREQKHLILMQEQVACPAFTSLQGPCLFMTHLCVR